MYNWERGKERETERERGIEKESGIERERESENNNPKFRNYTFPESIQNIKMSTALSFSRSTSLSLIHKHHMYNMCWHNIHKLSAYRTHTMPKKTQILNTFFVIIFCMCKNLFNLKINPEREKESAKEGDEQTKNAKRAATIINVLPKGSCSKWN